MCVPPLDFIAWNAARRLKHQQRRLARAARKAGAAPPPPSPPLPAPDTPPNLLILLSKIVERLEQLQSTIDEVEIEMNREFRSELRKKMNRGFKLPVSLHVNSSSAINAAVESMFFDVRELKRQIYGLSIRQNQVEAATNVKRIPGFPPWDGPPPPEAA
jgi:hypothetical protein